MLKRFGVRHYLNLMIKQIDTSRRVKPCGKFNLHVHRLKSLRPPKRRLNGEQHIVLHSTRTHIPIAAFYELVIVEVGLGLKLVE